MKRHSILLLLILVLFSTSSFSQVKYTSTGNFGIGTTDPSNDLNIHGNAPYLEISNTNTYSHGGILFYQHGSESTENAKITFSPSDNQLRFYTRSKQMLSIFSESTINGSIYMDNDGYYNNVTFRPYIHWQGNLGTSSKRWGTIYASHVITTLLSEDSDSLLKENIRPIEGSLDKLLKLRGVQYDWKPAFYSGMPDEYRAKAISEGKNKFGLIAQEVESVLPELVSRKTDTSTLTVSYTRMIPLLIEAIKEQHEIIETLERDIDVLKSANVSELKSFATSTNTYMNSNDLGSIPSLDQNVPNPFSERTTIKYNIPTTYGIGLINVYDLQGKQLSSYKIEVPGEGKIEIPGNSFSPGIYIYNLILDGVVIGMKQMVLTNN